MNPFCIQISLLVGLLFGNILFGVLPAALCKLAEHFGDSEDAWNRRTKLATFLLFVGAGIFVSNSFLVLLPQANYEFNLSKNHSSHDHEDSHFLQNTTTDDDSAQQRHHYERFPIPELVVLLGFFFAYVLQEVVYFALVKCNRIPKEADNMRVSFCSCAKRHTECSRTFKDPARPDRSLFGIEKQLLESQIIASSTIPTTNVPEAQVNQKSELLRSSILAQAIPNYGTVTNVTEPPVENPLPVLAQPALLAEERRLIKAQHTNAQQQSKFVLSSLLIIIVISLQYLYHAIRLVSQTETSDEWSYLIVASLQNFILMFSSASFLVSGNAEFVKVLFIVVFLSTVLPTGILIAMVNQNAVHAISHVAVGVVLATICGILVYVTFCNMLRRNNFGSVVGMVKFLAVVLGAAVAMLLHYANVRTLNK